MSPIAPSKPAGHAAPGPNGLAPPSRRTPFPHIDDLTSVAVDVDPHTPLRRMLDQGDLHMRQATTYNDFRRPDLALQEYIKAFTIAVDKIPKHKDYPSLKNDRGDLGRLYNALKMKITGHGGMFDKIKEEIKEDNRRTGVQSRKTELSLMNLPSVPSSLPSHANANGTDNGVKGSQSMRHNAMTNGAAKGAGDASPKSSHKPRPPVHPKPQALHGNAIDSTGKPSEDLASRFARLRTQEATRAPARSATVDTSVPAMPKVPDAIYSPARGTVTSEVANLPSSTPRGMFSRTNSIASIPCSSSARNSMDLMTRPVVTEQYATAHIFGNDLVMTSPPPMAYRRIEIPEGDCITSRELHEYMQKGSSVVRILLIDVRSREEFDEGHIMSQATICIEPAALSRGNVSAADIAESMGIAPDEEMEAFEDRAKFDLVVFYDQDSVLIPHRPSNKDEETALYSLHQALVHYNYGEELRNGPKLLVGGVAAWVDLFGQRSLQESQTSVAIRDGVSRQRRLTSSSRSRFEARRRSRAQTKALRPEQIKMFEESIQDHDIVRTTEDFLRRFPAASEIQQSMTSPATRGAFELQLPPAPPTRPAPAVPRTSYSGLSSRDATTDVAYAKSSLASGGVQHLLGTGLHNPNVWCYANSLIQALVASPGFADVLKSEQWPRNWSPKSAKTENAMVKARPQLMSRILGNLIQWLAKKQFPVMKALTLMNYCASIVENEKHDKNKKCSFGDPNAQQDVTDFLFFIFDQLMLETNQAEDIGTTQPPFQPGPGRLLPAISIAYGTYIRHEYQSVIDEYFRSTLIRSRECYTCKYVHQSPESNNILLVPVEGRADRNLAALIRDNNETPPIQGFKCSNCKQRTTATETSRFARLPKLLLIILQRFSEDGDRKINDPVSVPFDNLDLTDMSVPRDEFRDATTATIPELAELPNLDGYVNPCVYDCYAIVMHAGTKSSGHYTTLVRAADDRWVFCNDDILTERNNATNQVEQDVSRNAAGGTSYFTPYLLFYRRRDTGRDWPWGRNPNEAP